MSDHSEGHILRQHCPGRTFIETGTCFGRTVEYVLKLGATEVRSVEGHEERYRYCVEKFANDPRVNLWCGHSKDCLQAMIADLEEQLVFFLDAHPSGPDSYGDDRIGKEQEEDKIFGQHFVIIEELKIIAEHPIKNHTIIIDDQHEQAETIHQIYKNLLLEINPHYSFEFVRKNAKNIGPTIAGCLVAEVRT